MGCSYFFTGGERRIGSRARSIEDLVYMVVPGLPVRCGGRSVRGHRGLVVISDRCWERVQEVVSARIESVSHRHFHRVHRPILKGNIGRKAYSEGSRLYYTNRNSTRSHPTIRGSTCKRSDSECSDITDIFHAMAAASDSTNAPLSFSGHEHFRHRLVLSVISGHPVRIDKIRSADANPGLRGPSISLQMIESVCSGIECSTA